MYATGTLHRAANEAASYSDVCWTKPDWSTCCGCFYENGAHFASNSIVISRQIKERLYLSAYFFKFGPFRASPTCFNVAAMSGGGKSKESIKRMDAGTSG